MIQGTRQQRGIRFFAEIEAGLEVQPVAATWTGIGLGGDVRATGDDFNVLENLRLEYADKVDEPEQLKLWQDDEA